MESAAAYAKKDRKLVMLFNKSAQVMDKLKLAQQLLYTNDIKI